MVGSLKNFISLILLVFALTACGDTGKSLLDQSTSLSSSDTQQDGGTELQHSAKLTVMTYNINGIPCVRDSFIAEVFDLFSERCPTKTWYAKNIDNRMAHFNVFIQELAKNGTLPDVLLIQEAFRANMPQVDDDAVTKLFQNMPYPYVADGPDARIEDVAFSTIKALWNHDGLLNSGVVIFSKYPIVKTDILKFGNLCAQGICNAEKGVVYAQIKVPGLPKTIDFFNTHHQSFENEETIRKAQNNLMINFMMKNENSPWAIAGGDFNFKNAAPYASFQHFLDNSNMTHAGLACLEDKTCTVDATTKLENVLGDVLDHQFFITSGERYNIRPSRIEFGTFKIGELDFSDHEFHTVEYTLSW